LVLISSVPSPAESPRSGLKRRSVIKAGAAQLREKHAGGWQIESNKLPATRVFNLE
jgi:hypothetical protein